MAPCRASCGLRGCAVCVCVIVVCWFYTQSKRHVIALRSHRRGRECHTNFVRTAPDGLNAGAKSVRCWLSVSAAVLVVIIIARGEKRVPRESYGVFVTHTRYHKHSEHVRTTASFRTHLCCALCVFLCVAAVISRVSFRREREPTNRYRNLYTPDINLSVCVRVCVTINIYENRFARSGQKNE